MFIFSLHPDSPDDVKPSLTVTLTMRTSWRLGKGK